MTDRAEDRERLSAPIDMVLHCPACGAQHIDAPESPGEYTLRGYDPLGAVALAWTNPPHRSHLCHGCGHIWRPADVPTNGVAAVKTRGKNDPPAVSLAAPAVSLAAEVERLKACLFQMQEAAKDLARQLDAERRKVEALREALTKAADTFADYSKVLKLIGKDVLMQGCDIAEQAARAALAATEGAPR